MRGLTTADLVIAGLLATLAGLVSGGNPPGGLLLLLFMGGLYGSVRLTRGRSWWVRLLAAAAAFVVPLGVAVLLFR